ncbi:SDR family oxidoreductase [Cytophagaceae bacterium YF14B1]|uniref:SDR family oxidoreductase n=1 Tax=Xanthocytophaga flava TaxID=3048013 RepID=A0AAE3UBE0_9BACT|nr:SDR family oxidoreductase [Xanthocytophaga flavus]MDJ1485687.1 SDR family oxidoreductase [Xanthocytophaga flavus]
MMNTQSPFTPEEWDTCIKVLKALSRDPDLALDTMTLKGLVTKLHKNARKTIRKENLQKIQLADKAILEQTFLHQNNPVDETTQPLVLPENTSPSVLRIQRPLNCYICKNPYQNIHFFYHLLCPDCASLNYEKRFQRSDLTNRVALVTGGRIKIGYLTALRMLRDGARVLITTRFPKDCARRFSEEADFADWQHRLQIFGLDLRNIPVVEQFIDYLLLHEPKLDIIINNAAQTVKRPLEFYRHLLDFEQTPFEQLSAELQSILPLGQETRFQLIEKHHQLALPNSNDYFPEGKLDRDRQQIDLRPQNSWTLKLDEVDTIEMLEVQLVNSVAPFLLNSRLKPLLKQSEFDRRFIVNVSAMEGQFARENKTVFHPHTNMAKAALNMLTRTSANDYAKDGIYMNSVDTGWITQENPFPKRSRIRERGFVTPLDETDGMARIYDPVACGINNPETPLYGHFLKDYQPYPW